MPEYRIPSPEELQQLRRKVGLTQSELASRAGISQSLIARIERGHVNPSLATLRRILAVIEEERKVRHRVRELLQWKRRVSKLPPLIWVSPNDKVRRAVLLMERHGISQLPVIDRQTPIGSISERTIIRQLMPIGSEAVFSKSVREVMEPPFPTVDVDASIEVVFAQIASGAEAILVLDRLKPVGVITKIDVIIFLRG